MESHKSKRASIFNSLNLQLRIEEERNVNRLNIKELRFLCGYLNNHF